jgi:hypothetical protein
LSRALSTGAGPSVAQLGQFRQAQINGIGGFDMDAARTRQGPSPGAASLSSRCSRVRSDAVRFTTTRPLSPSPARSELRHRMPTTTTSLEALRRIRVLRRVGFSAARRQPPPDVPRRITRPPLARCQRAWQSVTPPIGIVSINVLRIKTMIAVMAVRAVRSGMENASIRASTRQPKTEPLAATIHFQAYEQPTLTTLLTVTPGPSWLTAGPIRNLHAAPLDDV